MTTLSAADGSDSRQPARPTMHDVARVAGVSLKTVSRVVNREAQVRPETTERVVAAVRQLGYRRNDVARHLRQGGSTLTVGLIIEDISDPFYSTLARAIEHVARDHGYLMLVGDSGEDPHREEELAGAFCARRLDGLVIVPIAGDHAHLTREMDLGTAVVFVDRPAHGIDVDTVLCDNAAGARSAVGHLVGHGHRRIGFVGNDDSVYTAQQRFRGYRTALEDGSIGYDDRLVRRGPRDVDQAQAAVTDLLAADPALTAVFAANNRMAIGALRALREQAPGLGLVGFDDFELADAVEPAVTVMAQDPYAMGEQAARLLFSRLSGEDRPPRTVTLPPRLVVRGSGEVPPR